MTYDEDEFAFDEEAVVDLDEFEGYTLYNSLEDYSIQEQEDDEEYILTLSEAFATRSESDGEDWD
jgi:hypothetical protein